MLRDKKILVVFLMIVVFTNGFGFVAWNERIGNILTRIILLLTSLYVVGALVKVPNTPMVRISMLLTFLGLFSMCSAYILHAQPFADSFIVTLYSLTFMLVPYLYLRKVSESGLVRLCVGIGIFWAVLMVLQQFTYPYILFAVPDEGVEKVSMRNGLYRFSIPGSSLGMLALFYYFQSYLKSPKYKNFFGMFIALVAIYLTCTRQLIASSIGCLLLGLFLSKRLSGIPFIVILLLGLVVYFNSDALFGEYITMTQTQGVDENYIRFIAYHYYGIEYNQGNLWATLFGNGVYRMGDDATEYGQEMMKIWAAMHVYQSDIGLVGIYNLYGLCYIFVIISFFWYVYKNRRYVDLYLKLQVVYMFVTSVMLWHFAGHCHSLFQSVLVFYLVERSIMRNKRKLGVPSERERILRNSKFWERTGSFIGGAFKKE